MPANIQDVHGELEAINQSIANLANTMEQWSGRMASRSTGTGGGTGDGGARSTLMTMAKDFRDSTPWGKGAFLTGILLKSQSLAFNMVRGIDQLQFANIASGRNIEKSILHMVTEEGIQLGGVENNIRTLMKMQEAGLNVQYGQGNEQHALLRKQLTLLDKDMGQGTLLLNFAAELTNQGFSKEEALEAVGSLSDIAFTSIQSATTQINMLKKMNENIVLLRTADPELAAAMKAIQKSDFFADANAQTKNMVAEMSNLLTSPEGSEQFSIFASQGLQAYQNQMKVLGGELAAAKTDREKDSITGKIEELFKDAARNMESLNERLFPQGMHTLVRQQMQREPFFAEVAQFGKVAQGVLAAFNQQTVMDERRSTDPGGLLTKSWEGLMDSQKNNTLLAIDQVMTKVFQEMGPQGVLIREAMTPMIVAVGEKLITAFGVGTSLAEGGVSLFERAVQRAEEMTDVMERALDEGISMSESTWDRFKEYMRLDRGDSNPDVAEARRLLAIEQEQTRKDKAAKEDG
tara:strand:- start:4236 stop:5792 length:1557 start_codon:yes stop_codon:yes gene_type:complete